MAVPEDPPRILEETGAADIDEATSPPGEQMPRPRGHGAVSHARGRRAMRLAVIVFVALGTGQYMQTYRPAGAAAAGTMAQKEAALGFVAPQPVASVVLTPVRLPVPQGLPVPAQAGLVLASAAPGGMGAMAAGCPATLHVTAEPGAMLGLALAAPCHGGERVVLRHAGLSVTGKLDSTGHLAVELPALAVGGAVSVVFGDGASLRGAAPVPALDGLRRVALQWRPGDGFSLHGMKVGAGAGAADEVSEAQPGLATSGGGWLAQLGARDVAQPMVAEVFTYPAAAPDSMEAAIVARVAPGNCGRRLTAETVTSESGKARVTRLTLAMPACGSSLGHVVLRDLFGELQVAASE